MMNNLEIVKIIRSYTVKEIMLSSLSGLITYLILGTIFLTPTIVISLLYVPYMKFFFLGMYIMMSIVASAAASIFSQTLQHYHIESINYEIYNRRSTIVLAVLTFIVLTIIYFTYIT
ncbi:hypothetical protein [Candidatus Xianfuyuplasma coldseepsis]|uniref:Uncharacterized protein n=1 Tax=Candidatus Xianfuyuplasma coldseepsis TaxID=2782163 RepID=A0A7L7KVU9_9MOLU|nr:hypothetical protein [Xianfuyuplasma coldseepsis]QMS85878.1 hypothetical protein G4Z02_09000 [Xianfuyuplasma coldseepsis]